MDKISKWLQKSTATDHLFLVLEWNPNARGLWRAEIFYDDKIHAFVQFTSWGKTVQEALDKLAKLLPA